jgi:transcriptional antiterminator RfaH
MKPARAGTEINAVAAPQPVGTCTRGGPRWYAAHTLPGCERRAKAQLENQMFRAFLPTRLKTVRHARKLINKIAPLFPRYLFVELDLGHHRWRSVNGTFGVSSLVMQGDRPHPVPRGIVETLIASVDQHGHLRFEENLKVGAQVRLAAGPFAEQLGVLERLDDSRRVRVLLNIMGAAVPVEVRQDFVAVA